MDAAAGVGPTPSFSTLSLLAGPSGGPGYLDGVATHTVFNAPSGIITDGTGTLYVSSDQHEILRVVVATGQVSTLAGGGGPGSTDGVGRAAQFNVPQGIVCDGAGSLYVADNRNHTIRKVVIATGAVTTLAGSVGITGSDDGTGSDARFNGPGLLAYDGAGHLFVGSTDPTVRMIDVETGAVTTIVGKVGVAEYVGGPVASALIAVPTGLAYGPGPSLYIAVPNKVLALE